MSNREAMQRCYQLVWDFRREMAGVYPTPGVVDSLRFAVTESVEALDVQLRQNQQYKRNHHKDSTIQHELTQLALMLLTALGEGFDWDDSKVSTPWVYWQASYGVAQRNGYQGTEVDWIAHLVSDALQESLWTKDEMLAGPEYSEFKPEWYFSEFCGLQALVGIAQHPDMVGLEGHLRAELEQIRVKWGDRLG